MKLKQSLILSSIHLFFYTYGIPPTLKDIITIGETLLQPEWNEHVKLHNKDRRSLHKIASLIKKLENKGYITHRAHKARSIIPLAHTTESQLFFNRITDNIIIPAPEFKEADLKKQAYIIKIAQAIQTITSFSFFQKEDYYATPPYVIKKTIPAAFHDYRNFYPAGMKIEHFYKLIEYYLYLPYTPLDTKYFVLNKIFVPNTATDRQKVRIVYDFFMYFYLVHGFIATTDEIAGAMAFITKYYAPSRETIRDKVFPLLQYLGLIEFLEGQEKTHRAYRPLVILPHTLANVFVLQKAFSAINYTQNTTLLPLRYYNINKQYII